MLDIHRAAARGQTRLDWLDSHHSFAFGDYQDPARSGFSILRVINEDRISGGGGFPMHGHQDMEIVTYLLAGALAHRDSMGNGAVIQAGDLQYMSAGTGVRHSEFNPSPDTPCHLLQIWLLPNRNRVAPAYAERRQPLAGRTDELVLLVSPDGRDGSVAAHQDGLLFVARLTPGASVEHRLAPGRRGYLQVARGRLRLGDEVLDAGDGAAIAAGTGLRIEADEAAELLLFELP